MLPSFCHKRHPSIAHAAVIDATEEYMAEEAEDCLAMWLADCCEADADAETKHGDLYASYKNYAERASERPMTSGQLAKELRRLKYQGKHTKSARLVLGLRLRSPVVTLIAPAAPG
jgi:phage/plasmid-associated DNA primase